MKRGKLRILLGAAPGVGKTYAMLDEGRRLVSEGRDVVVAYVETHGRAATAAMALGLEILPRIALQQRGLALEELDLEGVLRRNPEIALVDELAHSNVAGTTNEKRWQDVEEILSAGIDVITTVNVQHIESMNDVVRTITGVEQRETVPDHVVRNADQIELVDLDPQALRDRLASGYVYGADRIDAALSNFFRIENLTALRELALLWLADEVDVALREYRTRHGIEETWEARERVVVALSGGEEGTTLLRRGARIAARTSGGELLAVHVSSPDGLRREDPAVVANLQKLAEELGGTWHHVVGDDIPTALVEFSKGVNATQIVLGVSRRSRLAAALAGPGVGATVIRQSGSIDVHIVSHTAAGGQFSLPNLHGALSRQRTALGFLIALVCGPLLTWWLASTRTEDSVASNVLVYMLLVVVVALIGGIWPAVFAATLSGLTLDFFLVDPLHRVTVRAPHHTLAIVLYVVIALLVSFVVDRGARQSRAATRSAAEAELLATVSGSVLRGDDAIRALISRTREALSLHSVQLRQGASIVYASGSDGNDAPDTTLSIGEDHVLELFGRTLEASEQRIVEVIAVQLESALAHRALEQTAAEVAPLAASDRVRGALLTALGHDLRRPLASATAAVSGLKSAGASLSESDQNDLLATANESLEALAELITDLLDVSRLQAGALAVSHLRVDLVDVVLSAIDELGVAPKMATLHVPEDTPPVRADPVLLQRVVVNLVANALRFSPAGRSVRIGASSFGPTVELRVVDHGPGIPAERRDDVFTPFQRLGDTDNTTGLGLGLALARGFTEAMHGTLTVEDTPGGGVTMVVSLTAFQDEFSDKAQV